jgi:hypothetical protein
MNLKLGAIEKKYFLLLYYYWLVLGPLLKLLDVNGVILDQVNRPVDGVNISCGSEKYYYKQNSYNCKVVASLL